MSTEAQLRYIGRLCNAFVADMPCRAYANASGRCPSHDGKTPKGAVPFSRNTRGGGHRRKSDGKGLPIV